MPDWEIKYIKVTPNDGILRCQELQCLQRMAMWLQFSAEARWGARGRWTKRGESEKLNPRPSPQLSGCGQESQQPSGAPRVRALPVSLAQLPVLLPPGGHSGDIAQGTRCAPHCCCLVLTSGKVAISARSTAVFSPWTEEGIRKT